MRKCPCSGLSHVQQSYTNGPSGGRKHFRKCMRTCRLQTSNNSHNQRTPGSKDGLGLEKNAQMQPIGSVVAHVHVDDGGGALQNPCCEKLPVASSNHAQMPPSSIVPYEFSVSSVFSSPDRQYGIFVLHLYVVAPPNDRDDRNHSVLCDHLVFRGELEVHRVNW